MPARDTILGRILVETGALTPSALKSAEEDRDRSGRRLDEVLLRKGVVDEVELARALAEQLNLGFVAPPLLPDPDALALVPADVARRKGILPLVLAGRRLTIAMANPLDTDAVDDLRFQSGCHVEAVAAPRSAVVDGVLGAYGGELHELLDSLERPRPQGDGLRDLEEEASAAPIVKIVDHLLSNAIDRRASDIHIELLGAGSRVRFRIDGLLHTATEMPPGSHRAAISRVKVMAGLDISVKRRPQDGGFTFRRRNTELTVRVSTIPTLGGEKAVLRILDPGDAPRDLSFLGMSAHDLDRVRHLLKRRHGVLLASGPTGSGKTTTLSAAVAELAAEKINIVTLEDPVEHRFPGVAQMEIDRKGGVGFPSGLRAILRQDPDVILVGEVRDRETAEIAMSAAVTGHLVLTTIHTVDAPTAITRLLEMGVPPFLVAAGLSGVVAQRLIRRVCSRCDGRGHDCTVCTGGYRGRSGVFEVLVVDDELRAAITTGASITSLRNLARRNGLVSMSRDALRQVAEGVTTPHEAGDVIALTQGAMVHCANCDAALPPAAAGCPMCGRPRGNACACGEPLEARWRYCPACQRAI